MSEKTGMLYQKIARIMGRLDRMPKTGFNQHFKYKFVTDADVADTVRTELAAENIAFFASMISAHQENSHTVAEFEFTFACADSGEVLTMRWFGEADDKQDKGLSKAATSAEKYFLLKTFMLSTGDKEDDPDNADSGSTPSKQERRPQTPQAPPARASAPRAATPPAAAPDASESELDAALTGPEPDTRARDLARDTFPFADSDKYMAWQDFIKKHEKWNKPFWAAAKGTLNLTENDVHDALGVESVTDWGGEKGNVARLWLTLCEERIALDDIAAQANS